MIFSEKQYREVLEDICGDDCSPNKECILKEFLVSAHPSPRLLLQLKCVHKFKRAEAKRQKRNLSWNEAHMLWIERGFAEKFAEAYEEGIKLTEIYKAIIG